jgi:multiple sugar transport system substrate-binding protein
MVTSRRKIHMTDEEETAMQQFDRRSFLKGAVGVMSAVALGPVLQACTSGSKTAPATAPAAGSGAPSAAAKELTYWGHNYPSRVKIVNEIMVPGFQKDAGIKVTHNDFDTNQMEPKILASWAGGDVGPDLVSVGDYNLPNYVYRKMIAPVDPTAFGFKTQEELIAAYEPGALDGFIVDGKLYAVPMDLGSISMVYRKDFFKEAGLDPEKPPTTWEEMVEFGKKLTKRDASGKVVRAGWGWEARSLSSHFYYWGAMLPQKGVDFISADGKKNNISSPAAMEAFQYLYDTFHTHKFSALGLAPTISPIDDFGAGRVAMMNTGIWLPPGLEDKYPDVSFAKGVYGVARLPQFKGGKQVTRLNPWVWMVNARSKAQKEAWQFVAYMTKSPKNQEVWLTQANYVQPWKGSSAAFDKIPYAKPFLEDLKVGVPTPRTPKFNELCTLVAKSYDRISANAEKPEVVVPQLAKQIDDLLSE